MKRTFNIRNNKSMIHNPCKADTESIVTFWQHFCRRQNWQNRLNYQIILANVHEGQWRGRLFSEFRQCLPLYYRLGRCSVKQIFPLHNKRWLKIISLIRRSVYFVFVDVTRRTFHFEVQGCSPLSRHPSYIYFYLCSFEKDLL